MKFIEIQNVGYGMHVILLYMHLNFLSFKNKQIKDSP